MRTESRARSRGAEISSGARKRHNGHGLYWSICARCGIDNVHIKIQIKRLTVLPRAIGNVLCQGVYYLNIRAVGILVSVFIEPHGSTTVRSGLRGLSFTVWITPINYRVFVAATEIRIPVFHYFFKRTLCRVLIDLPEYRVFKNVVSCGNYKVSAVFTDLKNGSVEKIFALINIFAHRLCRPVEIGRDRPRIVFVVENGNYVSALKHRAYYLGITECSDAFGTRVHDVRNVRRSVVSRFCFSVRGEIVIGRKLNGDAYISVVFYRYRFGYLLIGKR